MPTSLMVQRNAEGADRPRSAPRHKIFQPTQVHCATGAMRAHLINVSLSGALVHATPAPQRGEAVQVEICGGLVAAQVRWADGPRFGLSFVMPLDPATLKQLLGEA